MKRFQLFIHLTLVLFAIAIVSCTKALTEDGISENKGRIFYAQAPNENDAKTYIEEDHSIYWTADDRLSVFQGPANEHCRYTGETGQNEGEFEPVNGNSSEYSYSHNYAIYPYNENNSSSADGVFSITLPAIQHYAENSFGQNANTMSAVTAVPGDNLFKFKNVCGYLLIKLYGGDIIRSIVLKGNNGEKIAGAATLTLEYEKTPTLSMSDAATAEITLDCGEDGVATGATADDYTAFWIAVPPTTFINGFSIEITNTDGQTLARRLSKSTTISRNIIKPMAAIKFDFQGANNLLTFSLSDGTNTYNAFDISNGYVNVQVPNGTDMTNMTASFTYIGAKVTVEGEEQTSGVDTHDFSDFVNPLTYTVTSRSGVENPYIIRMFDLPVVIATTPSGKAITSKEVWTEGCSFVIREPDGTLTDYGSTNLRGRGNASWSWYAKKPYAVKFDSKQEVLGMPAHKRWCLLVNEAGYYYSNAIGFELGKRTSALEWTPSSVHVELILNGEHKGLYTITEQIKVDKNRVDITEMTSSDIDDESITGGYLLTYDTSFDEVNKFHSQYYNMPVMIKDPDEDVLVTEQFNYIQSYINNFEASLKDDERFASREYLNYFDIDSYIDVWYIWEIAGGSSFKDGDVYSPDFTKPRSVYFHKNRSEMIHAGPVWDFNRALFYYKNLQCNKCQYYCRLFQDAYFVDRVKTKWLEFKKRVRGESDGYQSIITFLDEIHTQIDRASKRDWDMWWKDGDPYLKKSLYSPDEQYNLIHDGILPKLDFLESYINSLECDYDDKSGGNEDYNDQNDESGNFNFGK